VPGCHIAQAGKRSDQKQPGDVSSIFCGKPGRDAAPQRFAQKKNGATRLFLKQFREGLPAGIDYSFFSASARPSSVARIFEKQDFPIRFSSGQVAETIDIIAPMQCVSGIPVKNHQPVMRRTRIGRLHTAPANQTIEAVAPRKQIVGPRAPQEFLLSRADRKIDQVPL
jgi:hypothetical protein